MRDLTYRISRYPTKGLSKKEVDKEIAKALKVWSDVTDLKFRQKDSRVSLCSRGSRPKG